MQEDIAVSIALDSSCTAAQVDHGSSAALTPGCWGTAGLFVWCSLLFLCIALACLCEFSCMRVEVILGDFMGLLVGMDGATFSIWLELVEATSVWRGGESASSGESCIKLNFVWWPSGKRQVVRGGQRHGSVEGVWQ